MSKYTVRRMQRIRESVWRETSGLCVFCGTPPLQPTMDHIIPRYFGGSSGRQNFLPSCQPCNWHRQNFWPPSALAHPSFRELVTRKEQEALTHYTKLKKTPADELLQRMESRRRRPSSGADPDGGNPAWGGQ